MHAREKVNLHCDCIFGRCLLVTSKKVYLHLLHLCNNNINRHFYGPVSLTVQCSVGLVGIRVAEITCGGDSGAAAASLESSGVPTCGTTCPTILNTGS